MKATVHFKYPLNIYLGHASIDINVDSYREVVTACSALLHKFKELLLKKEHLCLVCKDTVIGVEQLDFSVKDKDVYVVPIIAGNSSFDSLGNLDIFYGTNKVYDTESMLLSGLDRRIADSSLFGQAETAFDTAQRKKNRDDGTLEGNEDPSTGFGSLNLNSIYGQPVPLHFGLVRTSGTILNSYIKHIQRGRVDNVKVSDYVE